ESSIHFYRISSFLVIPKWSDEEIDLFISKLYLSTDKRFGKKLQSQLRQASVQFKSIGKSYSSRLDHLTQHLGTKPLKQLKNIPRTYGGGSPHKYRSLIFYLSTLESNTLSDLQRSYLSSLIPVDSSRDFSYLHVPQAMRKTGLAFYLIQQKLVDLNR